ncbi:MAG: glycoside hydrolase family 2 [Mongoliibacter sp.]|uniref:sugar-binding domain-containing protein n=1 Tax=Mongoliibacter sp. TaxID=2022438 RepID=UPI0012EEEE59|nr:sugar-binding domain-containing protein [Mongoliibacter sp.]TVP53348.1 MAG: glycoside hydrolase family 2 [Mongoliibacter sp.]
MKDHKGLCYLCILILLWSGCVSCQSPKKELSLKGEWDVVLDSLDRGESEKWFIDFPSGEKIELPGTLDLADLGSGQLMDSAAKHDQFSHLTRKRQYIGKAWYQRSIEVPAELAKQAVELTLERVIWTSKVWINGNLVGFGESLVGPHKFKIRDFIKPGRNTITICIDNSNKYPQINIEGSKYHEQESKEMAHAYTNHTQIKWNGIIGELSLKPLPSISNVKLKSDVNNKRLLVSAAIGKAGELEYIIRQNGKKIQAGSVPVENGSLNNYPIELVPEIESWDEFNPNIYELEIFAGEDSFKQNFGLREITSNNGVLHLNGQRIFLRGTLECAVFPLTGHPPADKSSWVEIISTAKAFGLNHFRFHSWCPPKAAFEAADELGFYFQAELPHWNLKVGEDSETNFFLEKEAELMLNEYGNHPSFILMALGNELEGNIAYMNSFVKNLKEKDDRRLYTTTSFSFQNGLGRLPQPADDFFVTQWTDRGWIRGQGIFNNKKPHFDKNYQNEIEHIQVPIISHEIGQYSVYPDLSEIEKYTGVLMPLNFIEIKNDLEEKGLLNLAPEFTQASGKLAAILYKEEIERALKTPGFDGFQLLQLQDFPGQGTALVGLVNVFWESKGVIESKEFSRFNSEVVPLINMEKAVYTSGETLEAEVQIANFYKPLYDQSVSWSIENESSKIASGQFEKSQFNIGNENTTGTISVKLEVQKATKLQIKVSIDGTDYENEWPVWVYPENQGKQSAMNYTRSFSQAVKWLEQGKSVLLNPEVEELEGVTGRFVPVFWSPVHFPDQPATMGILCDPSHNALADFPTDFHSDWQWWDLSIQSKSLDVTELNVEPIVRVIDNFVTNRELSNVFETKVGQGKLLFTSIDLERDIEFRVVARQLRFSLENYMNSKEFNPKSEIQAEELKSIFSNLN